MTYIPYNEAIGYVYFSNKKKTPPIMHIERGFMCRNTFGKKEI